MKEDFPFPLTIICRKWGQGGCGTEKGAGLGWGLEEHTSARRWRCWGRQQRDFLSGDAEDEVLLTQEKTVHKICQSYSYE